MNKNSYICNYINENTGWRDQLTKAPYFLKIKEGTGVYKNLVIFNYNQYDSDFTNPIVQEARGIIIDVSTLEVVCWPFRKFGNYGESYADKIDWKTARTTEKIDGSIMKVWYFKDINDWVVSTNGNIDARNAIDENSDNILKKSFYDLFKEVDTIDYSLLDKSCTYIFELCHPLSRVVVNWPEPTLYHTGTRNNITGKEFISDIGIKKPKEYSLTSIDECLEAAKAVKPEDSETTVNPDEISFEGFVVNDANFNRIKIKSYKYVMAHFLISSHIKKVDAIKVCIKGEEEELLSYFPNCKDTLSYYKERVDKVIKLMNSVYEEASACYIACNKDRKEFGKTFSKHPNSGWGFTMVLQGKKPEDILLNMGEKSLVSLIEKIDS